MQLKINNEPVTVSSGCSVAELLAELGQTGVGLAVAVGEQVVPRSNWETHQLSEGDSISLFTAIAGG